MAIVLSDGTVIPSFLTAFDSSSAPSGYWDSVNDVVLRTGVITATYDPSDDTNRNKKFIEYDVEVSRVDSDGGLATIVYPRCIVASIFGSVADYFRWVPRFDVTNDNNGINLGAQVLILCINGNCRIAYIIGGIPNPNTTRNDKPFNQHSLDWEYNGTYFNINADGELGIYRKGATDNKGTATNAQNNISTVTFDKDGKINIGYMGFNQNDPNNIFASSTPFISLDQNNNNVIINGNTNITSTVTDTFKINSGMFKINSGSEALLNATTYRQNEQSMHQEIISALETLSVLINTAGIGISGVSPEAGAALVAAVPVILQIMTTIQSFENFAGQYLSKKNFQSDD